MIHPFDPLPRNVLHLLLFSMAFSAGGQNLVLNGSFEDTLCVGNVNSTPVAYHAEHWYNPNGGTADLYATVPTNPGCYATYLYDPAIIQQGNWQYPADGERMAGILCHLEGACAREYIQAPLDEPMQKGAKYCVSMKVCLAEYCAKAIDRMGIHFSVDPLLSYPDPCELDVDAQVQSASGLFLTDTVQWMTVEGDYIALGGEQYITLGNFIQFDQVASLDVEGTSGLGSAYYYIDDVVVEVCDIQNGIHGPERGLEASWDPVAQVWTMNLDDGGSMELIDPSGRVVHLERTRPGFHVLDPSGLPAGVYLLSLRTDSGERYATRIVIP